MRADAPGLIRREGLSAAQALDWQRQIAREVGAGLRPPSTLLWRCAPALIVTRPESRLPGFGEACEHLQAAGWPVCVRDCGGSAFPVGPHSVQIARILPRRPGSSLERLYGCVAKPLIAALRRLGVPACLGAVPDAFCAGSRDVAAGGRKLAGLAQAWRGQPGRGGYAMITASVLLGGEPDSLCRVVNRFQRMAGAALRCRPQAVSAVRWEQSAVPDCAALSRAFDAALAEALRADTADTATPPVAAEAV